MSDKPIRPRPFVKFDLEYAESIRRNLEDEKEKRRFDDIINDLECELADTVPEFEVVMIMVLFWLVCVVALIQIGGF